MVTHQFSCLHLLPPVRISSSSPHPKIKVYRPLEPTDGPILLSLSPQPRLHARLSYQRGSRSSAAGEQQSHSGPATDRADLTEPPATALRGHNLSAAGTWNTAGRRAISLSQGPGSWSQNSMTSHITRENWRGPRRGPGAL